MELLQISTSPTFETVFDHYPDSVREKMTELRNLVIETAKETEEINQMAETLKWGEPSFVTKIGSTLRMDWKPKTPNQYALYFQCSSRLVETFNVVFGPIFKFDGKRAIVFGLEDQVPVLELKQCIKAALIYHNVKHLPTLGI